MPPDSLRFPLTVYVFSLPASLVSRFSHVWLFATLWTVDPGLLCPWDSPDKNIEVGCHFLFQGGSSQPSDHTRVSCFLQRQVGSLPLAPPGKAAYSHLQLPISNTSCFIFVCCLSPPVMRQFQWGQDFCLFVLLCAWTTIDSQCIFIEWINECIIKELWRTYWFYFLLKNLRKEGIFLIRSLRNTYRGSWPHLQLSHGDCISLAMENVIISRRLAILLENSMNFFVLRMKTNKASGKKG